MSGTMFRTLLTGFAVFFTLSTAVTAAAQAPPTPDPDVRTRSAFAVALDGIVVLNPSAYVDEARFQQKAKSLGGLLGVDITLTPPHRFAAAVRIGIGGTTHSPWKIEWERDTPVVGEPGVRRRDQGSADHAIVTQVDLIGRMTTGALTLGLGVRFAAFIYPVSGERTYYDATTCTRDDGSVNLDLRGCNSRDAGPGKRDPLSILGGQGLVELEVGLSRDRRIAFRTTLAFGRPRLTITHGLTIRL